MSTFLSVGYCSGGQCNKEDVKLFVEPDSFPQRNFKKKKPVSLFPVSGSLTVTGIGILGLGMIFMDYDVK